MKLVFKLLSLTLFISTSAFAADYTIDPSHSSVGFKVRHLAITKVPGNFTEFSGSFSFDPKNIAASSTQAEIKVNSVDTAEAKRDNHLRDPDFFDVKKFPLMKFKSNKIEVKSESEFIAHGDLTIRDITRPVALEVDYLGANTDPWGNEKVGFSASAKINRKDFGLNWNKVLETGGLVVGDEVEITLEIQGTKKKSE